MLRLLLATVALLHGTTAGPCSFAWGNYRLTYGIRDSTAHFRLTLSGIPPGYDGWTAVGFGNSMPSGIDVIVIRILNGRVVITDEFVQGFTSPYPDRINNIVVSRTDLVNGVLTASFSRAIQTGEYPYDAQLVGCQTWQFAASFSRMGRQGDLYHHSQTPISRVVCLNQCRV